ncbi:hypothetical protein V6N11_055885 [Hibiscus sabdariffa]|uniref:Uncharacterized protein n=1 Tax=Hibiscus sabdariffa TaxID=183260 RepID=A0ABR2T2E0_9ROSI
MEAAHHPLLQTLSPEPSDSSPLSDAILVDKLPPQEAPSMVNQSKFYWTTVVRTVLFKLGWLSFFTCQLKIHHPSQLWWVVVIAFCAQGSFANLPWLFRSTIFILTSMSCLYKDGILYLEFRGLLLWVRL